MSEDLLEFENTVEGTDGRSWVARVQGAERENGQWIGWIQFETDELEVLETERETTQPNREDLRYWASGLTYAYLEGALHRAQHQAQKHSEPPAAAAVPEAYRSTPTTPRIEVADPGSRAVEAVMGAADAGPGTLREVRDVGVVVYQGPQTIDGEVRHVFAIHFGSANERATLANWLWSRLHGTGVTVHAGGWPIELTNSALDRALRGDAP